MSYSGIFDSHAHYDDKAFDHDRPEVLEKIRAAGVEYVVNIGADLPSSEASVALSKNEPDFYASIGVHPNMANTYDQAVEDRLRTLSNESRVVAIGEIGLDYHYDYAPHEVQQDVFRKQLLVAQEVGLPVVIHSREAINDTVSILKNTPPSNAVIHSFSGSAETAEIYLNMGFYLGFTGLVTFKNVRKVLDALAIVPMDRILLETDCPYMAPVPYRGKRCDSTMIGKTAEKIAEVKNVSPEEIIEQTRKNALQFYQI